MGSFIIIAFTKWSWGGKAFVCSCSVVGVADLHDINADPDPTSHFHADPDPDFYLLRI
jgi:hypothetical protein